MKTAVKQIFGNWDLGYALDKHSISSTLVGENAQGYKQWETVRTEAGEATYQLKYRDQWDQAAPLAQAIKDAICPAFTNVGLIIPMAASKARVKQPVTEVANRLAKLMNVPLFESILVKTPNGKSLKDIQGKAEKMAALKGTLTLNRAITNEGKWNALVVDDLYQSGATLEAACEVLRTYEKIGKIYVATLTWRY